MRRRRLPSWLVLGAFGAAVGLVVGFEAGGLAHPFWSLWFWGLGAVLGTALAVVSPRSRAGARSLALVLVVGAVVSVTAGEVRTHQGTGYAGYDPVRAADGHAVERHRPWGTRCQTTSLVLAPDLPATIRTQVLEVVAEAARDGLPVTTALGAGGHVVQVSYESTESALLDGHLRRYALTHRTRRDGGSTFLSAETIVLYAKGIGGDLSSVRKGIRGLIAESSGVEVSSRIDGTGISRHLYLSADRFSRKDLEVLRSYAGC